MGKIKNFIIELAETMEDLLWHTGDWKMAESALKDKLSEDEWEFYLDNKDFIKETLDVLQDTQTKDYSNWKNPSDEDNWDERGRMTRDFENESVDEIEMPDINELFK